MKIEYKRDLQKNYLILEAPSSGDGEEYDLKMAEQNKIRGLLPLHPSKRDGSLYFYYEITSKRPLESLYEKRLMCCQDILFLLSELWEIQETMRKYLLSPQRLLFSPELIYASPERNEFLFCYYPGEGKGEISDLAEFILKKLDHRDHQAVVIGYDFYQKTLETNFSLSESLREICRTVPSEKKEEGVNPEIGEKGRDRYGTLNPDRKTDEKGNEKTEPAKEPTEPVSGTEEGEETGYESDPPVIHRERNRRDGKGERDAFSGQKKKAGFVGKLFSRVHPAVLLSLLSGIILLEILLGCAVLGIAESGGCFFLMMAAEIMLNRFLLGKKKETVQKWQEEEESEEYQAILREMYQKEEEPEPIEETRCLVSSREGRSLRLVCREKGKSGNPYPDICPGEAPMYIGKIRGEADVILNSDTVSRMHARLEKREERCFIRDMNSKNGTFLNGRRLEPQEECEICENDVVAFAEIEYHAENHARYSW